MHPTIPAMASVVRSCRVRLIFNSVFQLSSRTGAHTVLFVVARFERCVEAVMLRAVVIPRQLSLTRCGTTTFQYKVTDTNRRRCEQTRGLLSGTDPCRPRLKPERAQRCRLANRFNSNTLAERIRRPTDREFRAFRRHAGGRSMLTTLRSTC